MYNLTYITDQANNVYDIAKATNDLSNGLYFSLVLLVLLIVYLAVFKKQNLKEVFVAGTFFIVIISALMFAGKLVTQDFLITPIILFFASIIIYWFAKD